MSEVMRKTEKEITTLMSGFDMLEASFSVVPPGAGAVPLIEQYSSTRPVPAELLGAYQAQQILFRQGPRPTSLADAALPSSPGDNHYISLEDTVRLTDIDHPLRGCKPQVQQPIDVILGNTAPAILTPDATTTRLQIPAASQPAGRDETQMAASPPRITGPRHVRPESFTERLLQAGKTLGNNIIQPRKRSIAMVAVLGLGVSAYTFWPKDVAVDALPAAVAPVLVPESDAEAKRTVLANVETLRQTGTCAPEAQAMADYITRQQTQGADLTQIYPSAQEYRTAAKLAAENKVPCTGEGADPAVLVNGTRIGADALLGYTFDVRRMCTITARVAVQQTINGVTPPADYKVQLDHLSDLAEAADDAC